MSGEYPNRSSRPPVPPADADNEGQSRENLDNTINNSTIRENPFEIDKSKMQRTLVINACSSNPPAASLLRSNSKILDALAPEEITTAHAARVDSIADQSDFKVGVPVSKTIRIIEEVDVIGLSSQIRDNLRNFPIIGEVDFKCKLINFHPLSEKRYSRFTSERTTQLEDFICPQPGREIFKEVKASVESIEK